MALRGLPLLTDENLDAPVVQFLRDEGFDVLDVNEEGMASEDDLVLFRLAHQQGRAVVTHDSDFGRLAVANLEPMVGIVFLRPGHKPPAHSIGLLQTLLDQPGPLPPSFLVVIQEINGRNKVRVRSI